MTRLQPSDLTIGNVYTIIFPNKRVATAEYSSNEGNALCFTLTDGYVATIPLDGWRYWGVETF